MAVSHAKPGEIVSVRPLGNDLATSRTTTLAKTGDLEIIRLVVPAGKEIPTHKTPGPVIIQCLEGRVELSALGSNHVLEAGQMLHLEADEPHAVRGVEDGSLLVTILSPRGDE